MKCKQLNIFYEIKIQSFQNKITEKEKEIEEKKKEIKEKKKLTEGADISFNLISIYKEITELNTKLQDLNDEHAKLDKELIVFINSVNGNAFFNIKGAQILMSRISS
jgi:Skp family chaperone for outer membrane proteins